MTNPTIRELLRQGMPFDKDGDPDPGADPVFAMLAERVEAVLVRHQPTGDARPTDQDVCRECSWAWPCPTYRALNGEKP